MLHYSVAPLGIQVDGFQKLFLRLHPLSPARWIKKGVYFGPLSPILMGSETHCSKIDGFLGTHGTHANGAIVLKYMHGLLNQTS